MITVEADQVYQAHVRCTTEKHVHCIQPVSSIILKHHEGA